MDCPTASDCTSSICAAFWTRALESCAPSCAPSTRWCAAALPRPAPPPSPPPPPSPSCCMYCGGASAIARSSLRHASSASRVSVTLASRLLSTSCTSDAPPSTGGSGKRQVRRPLAEQHEHQRVTFGLEELKHASCGRLGPLRPHHRRAVLGNGRKENLARYERLLRLAQPFRAGHLFARGRRRRRRRRTGGAGVAAAIPTIPRVVARGGVGREAGE